MSRALFLMLLVVPYQVIFGQNPNKIKIAAIDLKCMGVPQEYSIQLTDALLLELEESQKFELISRSEIKQILDNSDLNILNNCDNNDCFSKIGTKLNVDKLLYGNIGKVINTYTLSVNLVDVKSKENEKRFYEKTENDLLQSISNIAQDIVNLQLMHSDVVIGKKRDYENIRKIEFSESGLGIHTEPIKQWEQMGISRSEYIEYKKSGIREQDWMSYREEIKSPILHAFGSLIFGGWGQYDVSTSFKTKTHLSISGIGYAISLYNLYNFPDNYSSPNHDQDQYDWLVKTSIVAILTGAFNLYSSVDAFIDTYKFNKRLKRKYNISVFPEYKQDNKSYGIGLAVSF